MVFFDKGDFLNLRKTVNLKGMKAILTFVDTRIVNALFISDPHFCRAAVIHCLGLPIIDYILNSKFSSMTQWRINEHMKPDLLVSFLSVPQLTTALSQLPACH